ncbi:hypothetical protein [Nocardioides sp. B-3]|uniref:hypothetical protein n=1 Tax=Nocardioides sp. B-3 TaxID=2895565 RepID=UPI00215308E0|nr:hypothetical protein [Nocardioides sp. B-3]UUZ60942.1 hypothetical protein LP418_09725 [Nocardioides sp. B-3]
MGRREGDGGDRSAVRGCDPHHIDGILAFPLAGRRRDDVRLGMRTITFKKRTLVAYEVDESSGELVVNVLSDGQGDREASR